MKKLFLVLAITMLSISYVSAHQKQYGNGKVTANYSGSTTEIIDNENHVCIVIRVEEKTDRDGSTIYDVICGPNKFAHGLSKTVLKKVIEQGIESAAQSAAQYVGADVGEVVSPFISYIAGEIYDMVCGY